MKWLTKVNPTFAHQDNDRTVMEAYGFRTKDEQTGKSRWLNEYETIDRLMQMYQELTKFS